MKTRPKAVIACFRIPSWTHDPSEELRSIVEEHGSMIRIKLGERGVQVLLTLADYAEELALEHARGNYGTRAGGSLHRSSTAGRMLRKPSGGLRRLLEPLRLQ